ncbi:MAG: sigma-70 family RNA polymerase sigma factor [Pedobacter sp.]|nr:MAG: sigma-70 family RNA polymerase sigma factor [Pedobacter sp.]
MTPDLFNCDDDCVLLRQLQHDSKLAFNTLYQKYWKQVFNSTYKRIRDIDKSEDITQDIFTRLWLRRAELSINNLPAYLNTAVKNSVFTLMSKESRYVPVNELHLEIVAENTNADAEILRKDFMKAYEVLVNALPGQQKDIFRMRYHKDLSTNEIALKLHISPKTVRNHLGRALTTLRASLMILLSILSFL